MNNKKNNKGFSLVELIVVVAIMAVLVGVLAPAYLKYVENSRVQKDVSAVGEVVQAIKIAAANEGVSKEINAGPVTIKITDGAVPSTEAQTATALDTELAASIGKVDFSSKELDTKFVTIDVSMDANTGALIMDVAGGTSKDIVAKFDALDENVAAKKQNNKN